MNSNVIKVVVAALFLVIALIWVDTLEVITTYVFFSDDSKNMIHEDHMYTSRIFATMFITLLTVALIVVVWTVYGDKYDEEINKEINTKEGNQLE